MPDELNTLVRDGAVRVAINTGNRALVHYDDGALAGVSPVLGRRLAARLGARFDAVIYSGAGQVFADAGTGRWDVAFLAIDQSRARKVSFTRPYHVIEATYAVRADSAIQDISDADQDGVQILTATGSAYDMYLTDTLQHAHLLRSGTPPDSFAAFRAGRGDLVAGVRASLQGHFGGDAGFRILPGVLTQVSQAMVLAGAENPLIGALDGFVGEAMADGFVARELGPRPA